ncbi:MAG: hypothetical protein J0G96_14685 [Flavobacteriia bacterium]|nr:hypothetical protein [Flavobacteriia bacterium]OJX39089.1 MAG: hypothetical protein BGO87_03625 [Flavobacteriia bacterium 40-80]
MKTDHYNMYYTLSHLKDAVKRNFISSIILLGFLLVFVAVALITGMKQAALTDPGQEAFVKGVVVIVYILFAGLFVGLYFLVSNYMLKFTRFTEAFLNHEKQEDLLQAIRMLKIFYRNTSICLFINIAFILLSFIAAFGFVAGSVM